MIFSKQIEFFENFEKILYEVFKQTIEENNLILKDFIIEKQLYDKGIDGNEKRLEGYTRQTIRLKIAKGQPADRTTLKDSGEFHASIEIDAFANQFKVSSNVSYDVHLLKRYKPAIFKISNPNFKQFAEKYFIPKLKKYVNN